MIGYGERMVNDRFDGSDGFAIDGGINDSMLVVVLHRVQAPDADVLDQAHSSPHS